MKNLQITRIKPNPTGKDRSSSGTASQNQLASEWVDFKNIGSTSVDLAGVDLYHLAYAPGTTQARWDKIMSFNGHLPSGHTVRVHSGSGPESVIKPEDRLGAEHHVFTNRNYVWNNKQGDSPTLFDSAPEQNIDQASYDPYPPEGQVLVRKGNKLVPAAASVFSR
jgi:hypothetical protein